MHDESLDAGPAPLLRRSAIVGLFCASLVIAFGTVRAFQRGAHDFSVFHAAWSMVLSGRGSAIYDFSATPDRFLYAPGFAWLFSPLGWLPKNWALGVWCLAKAATVGLIIRELARSTSLGVAAWALVMLARPFLIDLEYGQVNVFILGISVWALSTHFSAERRPVMEIASWMFAAFAAVTKVFPLPLLLVPWLLEPGRVSKYTLPHALSVRSWRERGAMVAGIAIALAAPLVSLGVAPTLELYRNWVHGLMSKGLPLESHNQSFVALLHHYFSGQPTFVLAEGLPPLPFGSEIFSSEALTLISLAWTLFAAGAMLAWIIRGPRGEPARWSAVLIAFLIVPSHLIWKPYFALGLPVAAVVLARDRTWWLPILLALTINFTGFNFLGHHLGAMFEAAAVLLLAHLVMLGRAATSDHQHDGSTKNSPV